jgi:hypothetical protein
MWVMELGVYRHRLCSGEGGGIIDDSTRVYQPPKQLHWVNADGLEQLVIGH